MDQIAGLESERKFKYAVQLLQESYAEKVSIFGLPSITQSDERDV